MYFSKSVVATLFLAVVAMTSGSVNAADVAAPEDGRVLAAVKTEAGADLSSSPDEPHAGVDVDADINADAPADGKNGQLRGRKLQNERYYQCNWCDDDDDFRK
eukprot:CAMPEP_0113513544 /NCGR_PEP_ID=MMETSP0014_2-20120614/39926_1 /TAXON_ID=2857 /ORGANISM="Nitzschia sp." /LENGTH=102 /DNA_ID=CAMNT_0000409969 /DNA_START=29 /DNA_END=337 /DNA_ORIENTATION=- /assembly_acc=CAM_ASM_000159